MSRSIEAVCSLRRKMLNVDQLAYATDSMVTYLVKGHRVDMRLHCHIVLYSFSKVQVQIGIISDSFCIEDKTGLNDQHDDCFSVAQSYGFPAGPSIDVINLVLVHDVSRVAFKGT